jgi:MtN3 and saliva related transmembrane protein
VRCLRFVRGVLLLSKTRLSAGEIMSMLDFLGYTAAFCTTFSFLPQAIKVIKTRDTASLSLWMYVIFTFGVGLWLAYGIAKADRALIVANVVTFAFASLILWIKVANELKSRVNSENSN